MPPQTKILATPVDGAVGEHPSTYPKLLRQEAVSEGKFDNNARYLTCKAPWIVLNYIMCFLCVTKMRRGPRADTLKPMTSFLADASNGDEGCFLY